MGGSWAAFGAFEPEVANVMPPAIEARTAMESYSFPQSVKCYFEQEDVASWFNSSLLKIEQLLQEQETR